MAELAKRYYEMLQEDNADKNTSAETQADAKIAEEIPETQGFPNPEESLNHAVPEDCRRGPETSKEHAGHRLRWLSPPRSVRTLEGT